MGRRAGRSRKPGPRQPDGRLRPQRNEGIPPALLGRVKNWVAKLMGDAKWASRVGELSWVGELTNAQTASAFRIGEVYRRYHRFRGERAAAKSASLEHGFGSAELAFERMSEDEIEGFEAAERAAKAAWEAIDAELATVPRNVRQAVLDVCVFDTCINPMLYHDLRLFLDHMTKHWGEDWKRAGRGRNVAFRSLPKPKLVSQNATPKRGPMVRWDAIAPAYEATLKILRPDLDHEGLKKASETFLALADRQLSRVAAARH